ncbi:MAG: T9SS type A sorting domain-containing protein [Flavobacteriales bacterium]|nr:T9SS type A sorting domain-containing protein [Flavobacteriales bacterium]
MLVSIGFSLHTHAQQAVPSSGGDAASTAGSISWSVGQPAYTAPESSAGRVSQGVQQVYDVTTVSTTDPMDPALVATVGPNPTTDGVVLRLQGMPPPGTGYQLMDATGKLLRTEVVTSNETPITLAHLSSGSYLISLLEEGLPILVVRIIKH